MGFLNGLLALFGSSAAEKIFDAIKQYFPPSMSDADKAAAQIAIVKLEMDREAQANQAANEAERLINERIAAYEGTASDLAKIPFLGAIMLFLRGAQRVVWGFATLVMDWMWMTEWSMLSPKQEGALYVINFLVLGFLFGERAIRNVMPVLIELFKQQKQGK